MNIHSMALLEHVERMADALDRQNEMLERQGVLLDALTQSERPQTFSSRAPRHLSLFLESLPSRNYNHLRQKIIPIDMAAKILGLSPAQLLCLERHKFIKGEAGRYDVVSLLMWLDSDYNPDTEAYHAH
ncbi:MAG: hypothetical protein LBV79_00740 [Candidatus Adiutrix sp.]|jgi:hypothetical protein|nr:hypothetical protein [Candidatus Adiutrix sp.]